MRNGCSTIYSAWRTVGGLQTSGATAVMLQAWDACGWMCRTPSCCLGKSRKGGRRSQYCMSSACPLPWFGKVREGGIFSSVKILDRFQYPHCCLLSLWSGNESSETRLRCSWMLPFIPISLIYLQPTKCHF